MFENRPCMCYDGDSYAKRMGIIFTEILADLIMKVDDGCSHWPRGMMHTSTTTLTKPNYYDQMWSRDAGRGLFELARYGMQEEAQAVCEHVLASKNHGDHWGRIVNMGIGENELDGNTHLLMGIWNTWRMGGKDRSLARYYSEKCADVFAWFHRCMDDCPVGDLIPCASELSGHPEHSTYAVFPNYGAFVCMQAFADMASAAGMSEQANRLHNDAQRLHRSILKNFSRENMWRNGLWPDGSSADTGEFCGTQFNIRHWTRQLPFILKGDLSLSPNYLSDEAALHNASYREILRRMASHPYFRKYGFVSCTCWSGIGERHDDTMAGYGQNYMTQAALLMDDVNAYGKCLEGIARLAYDGNVVWPLSIDTNPWVMGECFSYDRYESGEDHTFATEENPGDEGNLVQSAETLKSLALTLGLEGTADGVRFAPRLPWEWDGLECLNMPVLRGSERINLHIEMRHDRWKRESRVKLWSDKPMGNLQVRFGPYPALMPARDALRSIYGADAVVTKGNASWIHICDHADQEWSHALRY